MSKKHIVLITTHRLVGMVGGAERVLCDMANALVKLDYNVSILCCDKNEGLPSFYLDKNVSFINCFTRPPLFSRHAFANLRTFWLDDKTKYIAKKDIECKWKANAFASALKSLKNKIDIFIAYDFESTYIIKDLLHLSTPIITTYHCAPSSAISTGKYKKLNKAVDKGNVLHVLSTEFIQECRPFIPTVPIVYIPNVAPNYELASPLDNKNIICVSRYDPEVKRPQLLAQAFSILNKKFPDWKVEFWGRFDNHNTNKLRNYLKQQNLEKSFLLCGTTEDISKKLERASIFVLPSKVEAFPLSAVEAMSMGLPVVGCNDCSSLCSLIHDQRNGLLSDPSPSNLANCLEKLINDEALRHKLGKQGRKDSKQFSATSVWSQWDMLIKNVLQNKPIQSSFHSSK